jgi:hypothetical protein
MSTRKLIGLAMLCGLAILVAGGIQLFRIQDGRDREVEVLSLGEAGTLGGITATVAGVQRPGPIVLDVDVAAGADSTGVDDLAAAWLVSSDGRARQPAAVPGDLGQACPSEPLPAGARRSCLVAFEAGDGATFARFRVGDRVLVWSLDGGGDGQR